MTVDDKVRDEKLQYDINAEAAKITALSSGKIGKYEHLTREEILPFNLRQIIQQAKLDILLYAELLKNKQKNRLVL